MVLWHKSKQVVNYNQERWHWHNLKVMRFGNIPMEYLQPREEETADEVKMHRTET